MDKFTNEDLTRVLVAISEGITGLTALEHKFPSETSAWVRDHVDKLISLDYIRWPDKYSFNYEMTKEGWNMLPPNLGKEHLQVMHWIYSYNIQRTDDISNLNNANFRWNTDYLKNLLRKLLDVKFIDIDINGPYSLTEEGRKYYVTNWPSPIRPRISEMNRNALFEVLDLIERENPREQFSAAQNEIVEQGIKEAYIDKYSRSADPSLYLTVIGEALLRELKQEKKQKLQQLPALSGDELALLKIISKHPNIEDMKREGKLANIDEKSIVSILTSLLKTNLVMAVDIWNCILTAKGKQCIEKEKDPTMAGLSNDEIKVWNSVKEGKGHLNRYLREILPHLNEKQIREVCDGLAKKEWIKQRPYCSIWDVWQQAGKDDKKKDELSQAEIDGLRTAIVFSIIDWSSDYHTGNAILSKLQGTLSDIMHGFNLQNTIDHGLLYGSIGYNEKNELCLEDRGIVALIKGISLFNEKKDVLPDGWSKAGFWLCYHSKSQSQSYNRIEEIRKMGEAELSSLLTNSTLTFKHGGKEKENAAKMAELTQDETKILRLVKEGKGKLFHDLTRSLPHISYEKITDICTSMVNKGFLEKVKGMTIWTIPKGVDPIETETTLLYGNPLYTREKGETQMKLIQIGTSFKPMNGILNIETEEEKTDNQDSQQTAKSALQVKKEKLEKLFAAYVEKTGLESNSILKQIQLSAFMNEDGKDKALVGEIEQLTSDLSSLKEAKTGRVRYKITYQSPIPPHKIDDHYTEWFTDAEKASEWIGKLEPIRLPDFVEN